MRFFPSWNPGYWKRYFLVLFTTNNPELLTILISQYPDSTLWMSGNDPEKSPEAFMITTLAMYPSSPNPWMWKRPNFISSSGETFRERVRWGREAKDLADERTLGSQVSSWSLNQLPELKANKTCFWKRVRETVPVNVEKWDSPNGSNYRFKKTNRLISPQHRLMIEGRYKDIWIACFFVGSRFVENCHLAFSTLLTEIPFMSLEKYFRKAQIKFSLVSSRALSIAPGTPNSR